MYISFEALSLTALLGKMYVIYITLYKISLGCFFQIKYLSAI